MLIIIDGTGPDCDTEYKAEFQNSFCKRLERLATVDYKKYARGPATQAWSASIISGYLYRTTANIAAMQAIPLTHACHLEPPKVFLAGHSRGGMAVIALANMLLREAPEIKVAGMFLFDAVNMTTASDRHFDIPSNVLYCAHAVRDGSLSKDYYRRKARIQKEIFQASEHANELLWGASSPTLGVLGGPMPARARPSKEQEAELKRIEFAIEKSRSDYKSVANNWGNVGLTRSGACYADDRMEVARFPGTHGALGGTPWSRTKDGTVDEDFHCELQVRKWMGERLAKHGLVSLGAWLRGGP